MPLASPLEVPLPPQSTRAAQAIEATTGKTPAPGGLRSPAERQCDRPTGGAIVLPWFVAGILLTLIASLAAWMNWSIHADGYKTWADPWMIENRERFPKDAWPGGTLLSAPHLTSIDFGVLAALRRPRPGAEPGAITNSALALRG